MMAEWEKYLLAVLFIIWILGMFLILNRILPQAVDGFLQVMP